MATFTRAVRVLIAKNLRYLFLRRFLLVLITAFIVPITVLTVISYGRTFFIPSATKGVGSAHSIKTLSEAFDIGSSTGRDRLYLVNNLHNDGEIDRLFDRFEDAAAVPGSPVRIIRVPDEYVLARECESSSRGVTGCFGAVVMHSSPSEGNGGLWNYSIQADAALTDVYESSVDRTNNVPQVYFFPLQQALDSLIATIDDDELPSDPFFTTQELPYTHMTQEEFDNGSMASYYSLIMWLMAIVFLAPLAIAAFHLTGFIAGERESGMSHLIDTMSVTPQPWVSQVARMLASYLSFVIVYGPSWIITAITMKFGLFERTNFGLVLAVQLVGGLALCCWALLWGSLFKKSQWSGITTFILAMIFGVMAQMLPQPEALMTVAILFSPSTYVALIRMLATLETIEPYPSLNEPVDLGGWKIPPGVFFALLIIHMILYSALAFMAERWIHGTASSHRKVLTGVEAANTLGHAAVRVEGFTKMYKPGSACCKKRGKPFAAVKDLDFTAEKGQIVALLGANGSGKSTTLDSIGGLRKPTSGTITIDGTGGLGIAPQKNVLWDNLTVEEHLNIFTQLKTVDEQKLKDTVTLKAEIEQLMDSIGLLPKRNALAKTLSGGQKRKLQLGMMLTGGSAVCCIDEVSTGIDPLSRRNIWDILMAERGKRTLIITTHFLDEADMLADHIAILSKGTLRAEGTSVELKDNLGGGYRVHVPRTSMKPEMPTIENVERKISADSCTYITPSPALAATVIRELEEDGITEYRFSNPTIEDVFLQLAEEVEDQEAFRSTQRTFEEEVGKNVDDDDDDDMSEAPSRQGPLELHDGRMISFLEQAKILFVKRLITVKRSWVPVTAALLLPTLVGTLLTLLTTNMQHIDCTYVTGETYTRSTVTSALGSWYSFMTVGPSSAFSNETFVDLLKPITDDYEWWTNEWGPGGLLHLVDTFDDFQHMINNNRTGMNAAVWLGDDSAPPTVAWSAAWDPASSMGVVGVLDMLRANTTIASSVTTFEARDTGGTFHSTQFVIYMSLALIGFPPLLALYQNNERRRLVRSMEYSNGVKPLALWLAYLSFDFSIVLIMAVIAAGVWSGQGPMWYEPSYMIAVLLFYGWAAVMFSHLISLATRSQLATWALSVIIQGVLFAVYYGVSISITTSAMPSDIDAQLTAFHFGIAIVAPILSVLRGLFVSTNMYTLSCSGEVPSSTPGGIMYYGGPILYLVLQTIIYTILVIWIDGGFAGTSFGKLFGLGKPPAADAPVDTENATLEATEMARMDGAENGLRVTHLTKSFGSNTAVDNVSFGIERGEIFGLLGPNGAGKSTIISLIRGDIRPTGRHGGDIFVEDYSILTNIAAARSKLGVCPQFDALDLMTVREHLSFYAKIRGIPDPEHQVRAVLNAVGLEAFADRQADALSGGNKRKLSLGIALMGNPTVLLLDEPSSGLDAASKRIMWQTLMNTSVGRSILLTTHSMEEADALTSRVGIISSRMLALDTPDGLRARYANVLYVHLICNSAPRTPVEEMQRIITWVREVFPQADVDDKTYHGQIRFSVRGADVLAANPGTVVTSEESIAAGEGAVGRMVLLLEKVKAELGFGHYSITPTTLDQVFLSIVRAYEGDEENQFEVSLTGTGKAKRILWA